MTTKYRWLNVLLDSAALVVALIVDLTLNVICMVILAPGPLETVGFVAIAFVVVLFAVRSWIIGNKALWAIFALVSFFFDLSFTLIATDVQTESQGISITAQNDSELEYLTKKVTVAQEGLENLRDQYNRAMRRDTLAELDAQIKQAERLLYEAESARAKRRESIESGALTAQAVQRRSVITAEQIFSAIQSAAVKGRVIPIIIFGMIFAGLQIVMVTAANSIRGKAGRRYRRAPSVRVVTVQEKNDIPTWVDIWVHLSWMGKRRGQTNRVLDRDALMAIIRNQGKTFPLSRYRQIAAAARETGVIDGTGEILVSDEAQAKKIITDRLLTKSVKIIKMEPELF